ncbi:NADH dehydrogenase [Verrucomicrobium sp. GAS474]|uniref:FAD-dependent oxidoreductase n=1 Tax=Verrucomicrobium sp. GAS474 TaxID=1882831 RepID=UPI00087A1969|nr:FAD-dependent oxidoreductase [Verrucomicrobium sp. GAS474]SDT95772.1 NADH dehydrogenase [Verrucomicrobium sp. GAS474]
MTTTTTTATAAAGKKRIVILGGGFGGVYAAVHLEQGMTAAEREATEIVLVSRDNYIVFHPLLPEVVSGSVEVNHVISPIRRLAREARLHTREIEAIDVVHKTVRLGAGARPVPLTLHYDHLVIAMGTRLDYGLIPGMAEHALPFKYLGDALCLRNQLVGALEAAEDESDPAVRRALLTFVVAGGGFSGVECIAEMNDFLREAVRSYHNICEEDLKLILLQRGGRILPELTEKLSGFADHLLRKRGVDVRLGASLKEVSADAVTVEDVKTKQSELIPTRTTVATVPAGPPPILASLPLPQEKGRIRVDTGMEVPGFPGVWALGDCAMVMQVDGQFSPPTAQHALRQAKTCADNIIASMRGTPKQVFKFTGLGKMGSLGRHKAVVEIFGVHVTGLPAWLMWRAVYLSKFPGFSGQIRLFVDWVLDAFLPRDITQLRIFHKESVHRQHFQAGEKVFGVGDIGDKVYFIAKGEASVIREGRKLATLAKGDMFGEVALLRNRPRIAEVKAETALDVVVVGREAFHEILSSLPGLSRQIEEIMTVRMGQNVNLMLAAQEEPPEQTPC